jgi:hypothetical protein
MESKENIMSSRRGVATVTVGSITIEYTEDGWWELRWMEKDHLNRIRCQTKEEAKALAYLINLVGELLQRS